MTIISKTAGLLSTISCVKDMHEIAKINSKNEAQRMNANTIISNSIARQMTKKLSYKDATRKNWLYGNHFLIGLKEKYAAARGYIKGFFNAGTRYIPNFALATVAFLAKNSNNHKVVGNKIANGAAIGLAILEGADFINNSTSIGQKTDYLKY